LCRVNARDRDSGDNARISYSIANIDADDIPFEIDHFSGVLKSRKVIDFESDRREYRLLIRKGWRKSYDCLRLFRFVL
jgi:protocadherin Fat 1/2/3